MEQVKDLAERISAHPTRSEPRVDSPSPGKDLHTRRMLALWVRMAEIFGHRWTSSFGESPSKAWTDALRQMPNDDMARGVTYLTNGDSVWPPTLPEFKAVCRPPNVPAAHKSFPSYKPHERNKDLAMKSLAECRRILGVPRVDDPQPE